MQSMLWKRIDVAGMDACAINQEAKGITISGSALYADVRFDEDFLIQDRMQPSGLAPRLSALENLSG